MEWYRFGEAHWGSGVYLYEVPVDVRGRRTIIRIWARQDGDGNVFHHLDE
jgi:hypothetical protein